MARDTSKLVTIPGELHSAATGNIVSASEEIFDYDSSSYQSQLNKQLYNVSAHDSSADAKYTLEEAIAAVPAPYQVGGLILTFISKKGDFEIYQLKSKDWNTDVSKWSIVPNNVLWNNLEYVEVHTDGSEKILYGVRADGDFYFGTGVPSQIKGYVDEKSAEIDGNVEDLKDEIAVLDASTKADIAKLDASVSTGFDRVDASIYELGYYEESPEYVEVHIDTSSNILYGVKRDDGDFYFGAGIPSQIRNYVDEKDEKIDASILEIETRFYNVNAHDGSTGINYTLEEAIAAVPEEYRNGGLILTFISNSGGSAQSSDNKYVQYRLTTNEWSTNTENWTIAEEGVYVESPEFVYVKTDTEGKILWAVKTDGSIYYGAGVPSQIMDYINEKIAELSLDEYEDIVVFLANLEKGDKTLQTLLNEKVDKEEGKSLIDAEYAGRVSYIEDPEERLEITKDVEDKVVSYRKPDGTLVENAGIEVNHLELTDKGMTDFQQALKDAGFNPGGAGDYSDTITKKGKKPVFIPEPRLARVNIIWDGNLSDLSKADRGGIQKVNYDVKVPVEFFDGQGVYFRKYALMSAQGNTSMAFEKKNISLKFFDTDVENSKGKWGKGDTFGTVFGNWVMQKTYHLKAFHTDFIRGSSVIAYQLADEVYKTRGIYADRPWKKALIDFSKITSSTPANLSKDGMKDMNLRIDNGARCMPDGFPVIVYQNGEFYGIYAWMLKKDADNFNMDSSEVKHIHIDGNLHYYNLWEGTVNWTAFEIRNPEDLVCMDGSDYNGDFPAELIDETSEYYDSTDANHVRSAQVKQYIQNLANRVGEINNLNATDSSAAKSLFDTYFDADNLIDYQLINMACGDTDGFSKNWQWTTWDGVKWYVNQYDKDMAFGNFFAGMFTTAPKKGWISTSTKLPSGLAIRYYRNEHKLRWQELVNAGIFNAEHIKSMVTAWISRIGKDNFVQEWKKWTEAPCNRNSKIDFAHWKFTGEYRSQTPTGENIWNSETLYNVGDKVWFKTFDTIWYLQFEAVNEGSNNPCLTDSYSVYPKSMGYRDSAWRYYKYIEETISNQNAFINSL